MNHLWDRVNPELPVDRFAMVVNCAPGDFEFLANLLVGGSTGQASRNIELSAGQVTAGFTVEKPVQFGYIGFGAACCDGGMAIESLL